MNRTLPKFLAVVALLCGPTAWALDDRPVPLEVTTLDDDLRDGGQVTFVLKMFDGVEQKTVLTAGQRLADNTTARFSVAPKPPYQWVDVTEFGLAARLHQGDGMLLQPDKWKVRVVLRGAGGTCPRPVAGKACFGSRDASFNFQGNGQQMAPLNAQVARCSNDMHCNGGNFCGLQTARCAVGARGANPMGCVRLPSPQAACGGGMCDEDADRCNVACADPDKDGDGEKSVACGGADCDDNDPRRAPSHSEVCDNNDVDEDCDATTFGHRDLDRDGYVDAACRNVGK
jgi:hypothetical protein